MRRKDRIPLIGGDEYDRLTKAGRRVHRYRKWLRWLKRKYNKRVRKEAKDAVKNQEGSV